MGLVVVRVMDIQPTQDPRYFRPTEVDFLLGDASKAQSKLGWEAQTPVRELAREMYEADLAAACAGRM